MKLAEQTLNQNNHTKTGRLKARDGEEIDEQKSSKRNKGQEHHFDLLSGSETESLSVSSAQAKHQVQRRLLLDVVVGQRAAILQLLASENQTLLLGRDALLVLDLRLHVLDRVVGLDIESDGLAG